VEVVRRELKVRVCGLKRVWNIFIVQKKWREIHESKNDMKVLYNGNGWETWIMTTGSNIKIGDGSKKTFKTVMAT
jgi:hypothetical protein